MPLAQPETSGGDLATVSGSITDVAGIRVGHDTDLEGATGCTVVLCEEGAVGGVAVAGAAPATRETDLLRPGNRVREAHAILLTGGSAFGLDAAGGVMRYLEERGHGFPTQAGVVPIVPAAALFDLGVGRADVRPDAASGYRACQAAGDGPVAQGCVGAGTGAAVGRVLGLGQATKSGLGSASLRVGHYTVGALMAVNAVGDVVDSGTGAILAGARSPNEAAFLDTERYLISGRQPADEELAPTHTTIGVVATDATLSKEQTNRLALMADEGVVRSVRPAHTMGDGDVLFVLATGRGASGAASLDLTRLGAAASAVVAAAVRNAVLEATSLAGVPAVRDLTIHRGDTLR